jgi:hypothetical protein
LEDEMTNVHIVTFPRSGHHAMIEQLESVSEIYKNYCEYYNCIGRRGEIIECSKSSDTWKEKGFSCGAGNRILKDHDFELLLPYKNDRKYVIQLRNPILSIASWYELDSKNLNLKLPEFNIYFSQKLKFWIEFVDKWYPKFSNENVIYVPYEDLAIKEKLIEISRFINIPLKGNDKYNPKSFSIRRKKIKDDGFLGKCENQITGYLEKLGLEKVVI